MIRLAVCIPVYGDTKAKFTLSLVNAVTHFLGCKMVDTDGAAVAREVEVFMVSGSLITEARNRLFAEAFVWGATHILWLDADHVFPADTIPRLLAHGLDAVGCNYSRRCSPTAPTAAKTVTSGEDYKNLVYTTHDKAVAGEIEEVDSMGLGVCLLNMRVVEMLQDHADKADGNFMPLFDLRVTEGKLGVVGEDVYFFRKVRAAGGKVWVDHGLSWEVGHICDQILTNAHAERQRDKWIEFEARKGDKFKVAA